MKQVAVPAILVAVMLLAVAVMAEAQQQKKIYRIGRLTGGSVSSSELNHDAFREGLRELGYVEGKNIVIEYRHADGKLERLPGLAAELVRLKVDVILTGGSQTTTAGKQATSTIPIVVGSAGTLWDRGLWQA